MVERRFPREDGLFPNSANTAFNFSSDVGVRIASMVVEGKSESTAQSVQTPITLGCTQAS